MEIGQFANPTMGPLVAEKETDYLMIPLLFLEIIAVIFAILDVQQAPRKRFSISKCRIGNVCLNYYTETFPLM